MLIVILSLATQLSNSQFTTYLILTSPNLLNPRISLTTLSHHSHFSLKSNSLMAIPKAWYKLSGCLNSSANVFSSILPNTMALGALSSYSKSNVSSHRMKFFIEACFTLPPKFRAYDLSLSFQRGCLFLRRTTLSLRSVRD